MSTITREFTKEQLIEHLRTRIEHRSGLIANMHIDRGYRDYLKLELRSSEIALASLEAEAAYFINRVKHSDAYGDDVELRTYCYELDALKSKDDFGGEVVPVYTAPPAPSVDEGLLHMAASAIDDLLSNKDRSGAGVWADIPAKLRRAAMLQGADGNSQVVQDCWVACSERMPDPDSEFRVCAYTPTPHEDVRFRFVPASLFKSVCRDATHWQYMLPPAAPQQA
ncbi:DUF551 domain-containing protein [Enterobacter ludwigii]